MSAKKWRARRDLNPQLFGSKPNTLSVELRAREDSLAQLFVRGSLGPKMLAVSRSMTMRLEIRPEDEKAFGPCECCGNMTRRVWGYVYDNEEPIAAYFVEWTPGHFEPEANFDLILGKWGAGTGAADRKAVALVF